MSKEFKLFMMKGINDNRYNAQMKYQTNKISGKEIHKFDEYDNILRDDRYSIAFEKPTMVCEKCLKKLGTVITPDPWKAGARNTVESGGRKLQENKALSAGKGRFAPYTKKFECCRICRQKVHQVGSHYCQACAYKKGICAMCGKRLLNVKNYKQSAT